MQIVSVKGEPRTAGGRHANERARKAGMVPAVIYGHGEAPETVAIVLRDLLVALELQQHVVTLGVGGSERQLFLKDVQYDHLQKTPIHVDLMRVDPNERIHVQVPIELRGTPAGVLVGGEIVQPLADVEVECKLLEIPDVIRVKIDHLQIGDAIHIKDLELPPDVTALHNPEELVISVRHKREEVVAAPAADGATPEPEVIGRVAKEKVEGEAEAK